MGLDHHAEEEVMDNPPAAAASADGPTGNTDAPPPEEPPTVLGPVRHESTASPARPGTPSSGPEKGEVLESACQGSSPILRPRITSSESQETPPPQATNQPAAIQPAVVQSKPGSSPPSLASHQSTATSFATPYLGDTTSTAIGKVSGWKVSSQLSCWLIDAQDTSQALPTPCFS